MMRPRARLCAPVGLAVAAAFLFAACGGGGSKGATATPAASTGTHGSGAVEVLGIWDGAELDAFKEMVRPWTGTVDFIGSRSITSLLTTRVEGGNAPDVAIPAEVGLFQQFAREGKLKPLSACPGLEEKVRASYPEAFVDLGTVDGKLYGFFMKADTKATIWYNPRFFAQHGLQPLTASSTFDDLIALSNKIKATGVPPWSIGQEAGDGSGFPGSDTVQQIVLNQESASYYDGVVAGTQKFGDPRMKDAWEKFGQIALAPGQTAQGNGAAMDAENFQQSSYAPFQTPPAAGMVHLGAFADGFIRGQFPAAKPGEDFNVMPWPGGGVTGAANIVYAFKTNPAICSFLDYIAGADAQSIWVKRGGFTSLNTQLRLDAYPDEVARGLAQQLLQAKTFRFDLDDAIGGAVQQAEFQGITRSLADPSQLDAILAGIDAARQ